MLTWRQLSHEETLFYRGFTIIIIVLHNYFHKVLPNTGESQFEFDGERVARLLEYVGRKPAESINLAYDSFGFVVAQLVIFLSAYGLSMSFKRHELPFLSFLGKRGLRLYPTFLLAIGVYFAFRFLAAGPGWTPSDDLVPVLYKILPVSNIFFPDQHWLPNWTEVWWFFPLIVQFYLAFPLLYKYAVRFGGGGLLVLSFLELPLSYLAQPYFLEHGLNLQYTFLGYFPAICLGMHLAGEKNVSVPAYIPAFCLLVYIFGQFYDFIGPLSRFASLVVLLAVFPVIASFFSGTVVQRGMQRLGIISLQMFLLHGFLREPFCNLANQHRIWWLSICIAILFLGLVIVFSMACFRFESLLITMAQRKTLFVRMFRVSPEKVVPTQDKSGFAKMLMPSKAHTIHLFLLGLAAEWIYFLAFTQQASSVLGEKFYFLFSVVSVFSMAYLTSLAWHLCTGHLGGRFRLNLVLHAVPLLAMVLYLLNSMIFLKLGRQGIEYLSLLSGNGFGGFIQIIDESGIGRLMWISVALTMVVVPTLLHGAINLVIKKFKIEPCRLAGGRVGLALVIAWIFLVPVKLGMVDHYANTPYRMARPWFFPTVFAAEGSESPRIAGRLNPLPQEELIDQQIKHLPPMAPIGPNIYLFFLESFRADMVTQEIAPNLKVFADANLQFSTGVSPANATHISWFSVLSGLDPRHWRSQFVQPYERGSPAMRIADKLGYKIHVLSSTDSTYFRTEKLLFGQKSDWITTYKNELDYKGDVIQRDRAVLRDLLTLQEKFEAKGNLFIVFLSSSHYPYHWPAYESKFKPFAPSIDILKASYSESDVLGYLNRYKNSVHYIDKLFGDFLASVSKSDALQDSIIAVQGDHGEEFLEHRVFGHSSHLCHLQLQIPLIYRLGRNFSKEQVKAGTKVGSSLDIFPTIFEFLGVPEQVTKLLDGQAIMHKKQAFAVSVDVVDTSRFAVTWDDYVLFMRAQAEHTEQQEFLIEGIAKAADTEQSVSFSAYGDEALSHFPPVFERMNLAARTENSSPTKTKPDLLKMEHSAKAPSSEFQRLHKEFSVAKAPSLNDLRYGKPWRCRIVTLNEVREENLFQFNRDLVPNVGNSGPRSTKFYLQRSGELSAFDDDGNLSSVRVLQDGSLIEEWALVRSEEGLRAVSNPTLAAHSYATCKVP